jgi:hypothetical protein
MFIPLKTNLACHMLHHQRWWLRLIRHAGATYHYRLAWIGCLIRFRQTSSDLTLVLEPGAFLVRPNIGLGTRGIPRQTWHWSWNQEHSSSDLTLVLEPGAFLIQPVTTAPSLKHLTSYIIACDNAMQFVIRCFWSMDDLCRSNAWLS